MCLVFSVKIISKSVICAARIMPALGTILYFGCRRSSKFRCLFCGSADLEEDGHALPRFKGSFVDPPINTILSFFFFSFRGTYGHPGYSCCHQQRACGEHTWPSFRLHLLQQLLPAISVPLLQQSVQLPAILHGLGYWLHFWGCGKPSWGIPCEEQPSEPTSTLCAWSGRKPVAGKMLPRVNWICENHTHIHTPSCLTCVYTLYKICKEFFTPPITSFNPRGCKEL